MTRSQRAPSAFLAVHGALQLVLSQPSDYVSLDAARDHNGRAALVRNDDVRASANSN
jgi:hypothetical protein